MENRVSQLEKKIGYEFSDRALIKEALTHSSYVKEHGDGTMKSNERLEFLGDAFLDAIAGEELYERFPDAEEGRLTKLRAAIVCERSLASIGSCLDIGSFMMMGNGEDKQGGRHRESIMADAVEALIGAIYLDGGYMAARSTFLSLAKNIIELAASGKIIRDYKSSLQEIIQSQGGGRIVYQVEREEGPDHNKTFYINLLLNDRIIGSGSGRTKKAAEQHAAKEAIERGIDNVF